MKPFIKVTWDDGSVWAFDFVGYTRLGPEVYESTHAEFIDRDEAERIWASNRRPVEAGLEG